VCVRVCALALGAGGVSIGIAGRNVGVGWRHGVASSL
jgi:hypothetical protein